MSFDCAAARAAVRQASRPASRAALPKTVEWDVESLQEARRLKTGRDLSAQRRLDVAANDTGAKTSTGWRRNWRSALLTPGQAEQITVSQPIDEDATAIIGERSVFRRVGAQFIERQRQCDRGVAIDRAIFTRKRYPTTSRVVGLDGFTDNFRQPGRKELSFDSRRWALLSALSRFAILMEASFRSFVLRNVC